MIGSAQPTTYRGIIVTRREIPTFTVYRAVVGEAEDTRAGPSARKPTCGNVYCKIILGRGSASWPSLSRPSRWFAASAAAPYRVGKISPPPPHHASLYSPNTSPSPAFPIVPHNRRSFLVPLHTDNGQRRDIMYRPLPAKRLHAGNRRRSMATRRLGSRVPDYIPPPANRRCSRYHRGFRHRSSGCTESREWVGVRERVKRKGGRTISQRSHRVE